MIKQAIVKGVAAAAAVAGVLTVAPSAARAAWVCQAGWLCFYQNTDATGSAGVLKALNPRSGAFTGTVADFRNYSYTNGSNLNDSISSVTNNSDYDLILYNNINFSDTRVLIPRRSGTWNLNNVRVFAPNGDPIDSRSINDHGSSAQVGICTETTCRR